MTKGDQRGRMGDAVGCVCVCVPGWWSYEINNTPSKQDNGSLVYHICFLFSVSRRFGSLCRITLICTLPCVCMRMVVCVCVCLLLIMMSVLSDLRTPSCLFRYFSPPGCCWNLTKDWRLKRVTVVAQWSRLLCHTVTEACPLSSTALNNS